jgi:hypothetical protein
LVPSFDFSFNDADDSFDFSDLLSLFFLESFVFFDSVELSDLFLESEDFLFHSLEDDGVAFVCVGVLLDDS